MPATLDLQTPQAGTILLRLNRPDRLNAINEVMVRELMESCASIGADRAARAVVITGAGRGFCSGIDMRDFGPSMLDAADPAIDRLRFQEGMASLPQELRALPQPVIAAVNGPAVGGGLVSIPILACGGTPGSARSRLVLAISMIRGRSWSAFMGTGSPR